MAQPKTGLYGCVHPTVMLFCICFSANLKCPLLPVNKTWLIDDVI